MKPKEKPCSGIGKAKGFDSCGELSLNRRYGLGLTCCYPKWLYNTPEGKEKLSKALKIASAPRKSLEKAIKKEKESKGIQAALTLTKQVVHKMVRTRDEWKPCISCGCQWSPEFQAGHCFPTRYRSIRFNFFNINGQCQKCNLFVNGNETQYLINLPNRIGMSNFKELKRLAALDKKFNKHWTRTELAEIRKSARAIIKKINNYESN